jgi:methylmalonyl-CoA/ethylmalonyl-CoA epimerase
VAEQKVKVAFFDLNGVHIELLEPISDDSPIAVFIQKKGPGLHHIALASDDLEKELIRLDKEGIQLLDKTPRCGANQKKIAFAHPKSTLKVLMEICQ